MYGKTTTIDDLQPLLAIVLIEIVLLELYGRDRNLLILSLCQLQQTVGGSLPLILMPIVNTFGSSSIKQAHIKTHFLPMPNHLESA